MGNEYIYPGVPNDLFAGMTGTGKIIRDAWVFEIIPETETCKGWTMQRLDALNHQVNDEWKSMFLVPGDWEAHKSLRK